MTAKNRFSWNKGSRKNVLMFVFVCCLIPLLYGLLYFNTKLYGIRAYTNLTYKPRQVKHFLQNDPQWFNDEIGNSGRKMSSHGCLVSVLAAAIDDLGCPTNPGELNRMFGKKGVYLDNGDVVWYKIKYIFPSLDYEYKRIFSSRTLEHDLAQGRLPIVKVKYHKKGVFHWVLIVGADGDDFLVIDPLRQDKQTIKLSVHGNVYAYRVLSVKVK